MIVYHDQIMILAWNIMIKSRFYYNCIMTKSRSDHEKSKFSNPPTPHIEIFVSAWGFFILHSKQNEDKFLTPSQTLKKNLFLVCWKEILPAGQ